MYSIKSAEAVHTYLSETFEGDIAEHGDEEELYKCIVNITRLFAIGNHKRH